MRSQVNIIEVITVLAIFLSSVIFLLYFYNSSVYSMTYELKREVDALAPEIFYADFLKREGFNYYEIKLLSTDISEYENYLNYLKVLKIGFCIYPKILNKSALIYDSNKFGLVIVKLNETCIKIKSNSNREESLSISFLSDYPATNATDFLILKQDVPIPTREHEIYKVILKIQPLTEIYICNILSDYIYIHSSSSNLILNNISYPLCLHPGESPDDIRFLVFGKFVDSYSKGFLSIYRGIGK